MDHSCVLRLDLCLFLLFFTYLFLLFVLLLWNCLLLTVYQFILFIGPIYGINGSVNILNFEIRVATIFVCFVFNRNFATDTDVQLATRTQLIAVLQIWDFVVQNHIHHHHHRPKKIQELICEVLLFYSCFYLSKIF